MEIPSLSSNSDVRSLSGSARHQQLSINLSLAIGFLMLAGKWYAYVITGSAAILSDAAESVVHIIAVTFAAFSVWFSFKPADDSHPYGHDKIAFFSAGVEGAMIVLAALVILFESVKKWLTGLEIENISEGMAFVAAAAGINGLLGAYLVWQGKRHSSLILQANGKHILTDVWTSAGVIVGLLMVQWTGWLPFDPILAIAIAINILWSGSKLLRRSIGGLMDERDPNLEQRMREVLDRETALRDVSYHEFRCRNAGTTIWVEFHLLFPSGTPIERAHWKATEIEAALKSSLALPMNIISHLEPSELHEETHQQLKSAPE